MLPSRIDSLVAARREHPVAVAHLATGVPRMDLFVIGFSANQTTLG